MALSGGQNIYHVHPAARGLLGCFSISSVSSIPTQRSVLSTLFSSGVVTDTLAFVLFGDIERSISIIIELQQISNSKDNISFIHFVTH